MVEVLGSVFHVVDLLYMMSVILVCLKRIHLLVYDIHVIQNG